MTRKSPQAVFHVASGDPHLGQLLRKAGNLQKLEVRIRRALPPALAERVRVVDLDAGRLVLGAPTPAVASRLRYARGAIVKALGEDCSPPVHQVKVRVVGGEG